MIFFLFFCNWINFFFQKYVICGVDFNEEYFFNKFSYLCDYFEYYQQQSGKDDLEGIVCLEFGMGWYLIILLGYFFKGVVCVYSVDILVYFIQVIFLCCFEEMEWYEECICAGLGIIWEDCW